MNGPQMSAQQHSGAGQVLSSAEIFKVAARSHVRKKKEFHRPLIAAHQTSDFQITFGTKDAFSSSSAARVWVATLWGSLGIFSTKRSPITKTSWSQPVEQSRNSIGQQKKPPNLKTILVYFDQTTAK
jgi:hypothetical protein